jgi:hypothetical protein
MKSFVIIASIIEDAPNKKAALERQPFFIIKRDSNY